MPTYAAPGVYVEEVVSTQKVLSAAPTAVAAFVGFTERYPTDDPADPDGLAPGWSPAGPSSRTCTAASPRARCCRCRCTATSPTADRWPTSSGYRTPRRPASRPAGNCRPPTAHSGCRSPSRASSRTPISRIQVSTDETDEEGPSPFSIDVLSGGHVVESFPDLTLGKGKRNVATVINGTSTKIKVNVLLDEKTDLSGQIEVLKPGLYPLEKATPTAVPVTGRKFAGSESARQGINGLAVADDVTMVVVPDLVTAATKADGTLDLGLWKAVQTSLISHCEQNGNRMAVLDAPPGMTPQQIRDWRSEVAMYDSAYAALYYPWIKVENPIGVNGDAEVFIPPSGHIAGVWARTDESRGVWKAPANDTIRGCLDVAYGVTQNEQSVLNPIGINCIRPFGTRGIRIWGARTLASDSDWRYINVRRLFNMVETTIAEGTQWAVFEPNDVALWEGIKRTLNAFLRGLWSAGALFGQSVDQAFYVKCDAETNPPESIDQGLLIVEVGIAPVKPAEFVVFRIAQHKQIAS